MDRVKNPPLLSSKPRAPDAENGRAQVTLVKRGAVRPTVSIVSELDQNSP